MIYFYYKNDTKKEPILKTTLFKSRLLAAKYFAFKKRLDIKDFLKIFDVAIMS